MSKVETIKYNHNGINITLYILSNKDNSAILNAELPHRVYYQAFIDNSPNIPEQHFASELERIVLFLEEMQDLINKLPHYARSLLTQIIEGPRNPTQSISTFSVNRREKGLINIRWTEDPKDEQSETSLKAVEEEKTTEDIILHELGHMMTFMLKELNLTEIPSKGTFYHTDPEVLWYKQQLRNYGSPPISGELDGLCVCMRIDQHLHRIEQPLRHLSFDEGYLHLVSLLEELQSFSPEIFFQYIAPHETAERYVKDLRNKKINSHELGFTPYGSTQPIEATADAWRFFWKGLHNEKTRIELMSNYPTSWNWMMDVHNGLENGR